MDDLSLVQHIQDLQQGIKTLVDTIGIVSNQVRDCERHIAGLQHQARAHHAEISELRVRVAQLEKQEALSSATDS